MPALPSLKPLSRTARLRWQLPLGVCVSTLLCSKWMAELTRYRLCPMDLWPANPHPFPK